MKDVYRFVRVTGRG